MRNCAAIADQFSQLLSPLQYAPPIHSNGQFAVPALPPLLASGRGKRKAGEEGEGHKAKRVRKPKDPNAPKRPASSYLLFQNEIRQDLKAKNPSMPNNELLGLIAKMWKEMSPEEKDVRIYPFDHPPIANRGRRPTRPDRGWRKTNGLLIRMLIRPARMQQPPKNLLQLHLLLRFSRLVPDFLQVHSTRLFPHRYQSPNQL